MRKSPVNGWSTANRGVDVADSIHHELGARCVGARVWGPSARFEGQRVGREHELADDDAVEMLD